jgi:Protein of unknown function (DUF3712)
VFPSLPYHRSLNPPQVAWVNGTGKNQTVIPLGHMTFQPLSAKHTNKRAEINQTTTFVIDDQAAFGEFTGAMITQQNFTWRLTSNNLKVNAVKFPQAKGIHFSKDTTLNGACPYSLPRAACDNAM